MRATFSTVVILPGALALACALPAHAQVFKWVDDKGAVNYSTTPPGGRSARAVEVPARLSSYTPPPAETRPARAQDDALRQRVAKLEADLERERRERVETPAAQSRADREDEARKRALDNCLRNRGVDCEGESRAVTWYPTQPVVLVRRPPRIVPTLPVAPTPAPAPASPPSPWGQAPASANWGIGK